jgi:hypothetical protein
MDYDAPRVRVREQVEPISKDWADDAACKNHKYITTAQFFLDPPKRVSRLPKQTNLLYEQAREVCLGECPVREECLLDALRWERGLAGSARYGLFGGLDPAQRGALEKNRRSLIKERG